ncbi:hypothetical protein ACROYT_G008855 [Oculina patagonica]
MEQTCRNKSKKITRVVFSRCCVVIGKSGQGEAYGNLLKAGPDRTLETIDVYFTGTDPEYPATEFHMEKSDDKQANALRYRSGDGDYYLAVDTDPDKAGQVKLCKLDGFPSEDKYFFRIKAVGPEIETFHTFQSIKTMGYLHCGNDGKVFMKEAATDAKGVPEDRQTWFRFMRPKRTIQEQVFQFCKEEHALLTENGYVFESETTTVTKTVEDSEALGMENFESTNPEEGDSENTQKQNSEDPEVGNSVDPWKEKCDGQGRGDSKDPGDEVNHEGHKDLKDGNSGESENGNLEVSFKENYNDLGETENSHEKKTSE